MSTTTRIVPRIDVAARRALKAIEVLDEAIAQALTDDEPQDRLVASLALLDRAASHDRAGASQRLSGALSTLKGYIGRHLPFEQTATFEGIGVLKRSMSGRRYAWSDGRRLAHLIAARAAEEATVDRDTGEIRPVPPAVLAGAVADALIACGGLDNASNAWRGDSLRARGIDPKDWRVVVSEGTVSARWAD